jgi:hypothetical protein
MKYKEKLFTIRRALCIANMIGEAGEQRQRPRFAQRTSLVGQLTRGGIGNANCNRQKGVSPEYLHKSG